LRIPPTVYYDLLADVQEVEEKQEPMVEIDLYSVIKQKYIEREVLDKLRAEIDKARFVDKDTRICKNALASGLEVALQIIDKYKGESEE
jgi:hypothetical protein